MSNVSELANADSKLHGSDVVNFFAGPSGLPQEVLVANLRDQVGFGGIPVGVGELSHRPFTRLNEKGEMVTVDPIGDLIQETKRLLKKTWGDIDKEGNETDRGKEYDILFLQGGASQQFGMIPRNLLTEEDGKMRGKVIVLETGDWSKKAIQALEQLKEGNPEIEIVRVRNFGEIKPEDLATAKYIHITSNETIRGTRNLISEAKGNLPPIVMDTSSDLLSGISDQFPGAPIEFASLQKNGGLAGLAVVKVRKDLLKEKPTGLTDMESFAVHAKENSRYNTPPAVAIAAFRRMLEWVLMQEEQDGEMTVTGLDGIGVRNWKKATLLYDFLDQSRLFKANIGENDYAMNRVASADDTTALGGIIGDRSLMNVTFTIQPPEGFSRTRENLEQAFLKEALKYGLLGLEGHRSVKGFRASIYNARTVEEIQRLVDCMKSFEESVLGPCPR